ncbi:unnamed protein product, partial [Prorocentrum cordatum]
MGGVHGGPGQLTRKPPAGNGPQAHPKEPPAVVLVNLPPLEGARAEGELEERDAGPGLPLTGRVAWLPRGADGVARAAARAASDGLPEEPEGPAGAAAEAVPAAPVPGDAGLSTSTTLGKYDCSEQSEDRSTWSALKIVWCCQYEEVACDLADKAPGAAESVDMGSCAQYGCVEYDQGHDCQCNLGCLEHSNCCVDFAQSCASMQSWPEAPGADAARSVPLPEPMVDASAAALSQETRLRTLHQGRVESTTPPPPTVSVTSPAPSTTAVELLTTYGAAGPPRQGRTPWKPRRAPLRQTMQGPPRGTRWRRPRRPPRRPRRPRRRPRRRRPRRQCRGKASAARRCLRTPRRWPAPPT